MVLGEDEFLLQTFSELLKLRVRRFDVPVADEAQTALQRHAAFVLRTGIQSGDPETVRVAVALERFLGDPSRVVFEGFESRPLVARQFELLQDLLSEELRLGRITVERVVVDQLAERPMDFIPELPPLPPPPRETTTTFFDVRFVDEVGQSIKGVRVEYEVDGGFRDVTTNPAGVALLEGVKDSTAKVRIAEVQELEKAVEPRWAKRRLGAPPKEANSSKFVFQGLPVGPLGVKAVVPNTVILEPPRGRLFLELLDKTGRVRHAGRSYTVTGPEAFSGTTDAQGRLVHDDVFPGDYELTLTLEFFEGKDKQTDTYRAPLVVLAQDQGEPERRLLGVLPHSVLARLHLFFNTNKTFLLPSALPSVRALRKLYLRRSPCELLVVGHADTAGGASYNDQLSLERAEATVAYLKDDVEGWFKFYGEGIEKKKRWGKAEDHLMIISMPGFKTKPEGEDAVSWYQRTRELAIDGKAGKDTRRKLIAEYMSLDGASLSDLDVEVVATAHGCGEHFPLDESGENLDTAPANDQRDPNDRRVELFFFDPEFGIVPKPAGKNSKAGSAEYPAWRNSVTETFEFDPEDLDGPKVTFVELADAHFRTDSSVVLPEGENPDQKGGHQALTSVGVLATVLRFNEERPGRTLLVAGHTDTAADPDYNQKLSEERAKVALALLKGDRESFRTLCNARHTVADYKQILSWVSQAFEDVDFDCAPAKIDDNAATGVQPVSRFQKAYNENKAKMGITQPDLAVDGAVGLQTWGAFFDCYEFALQEELGEDAAGLAGLRSALEFADPKRESLGFSEHFPIEELGVDNFRSETNRRVEILFFEQGEEPDLEHAEEDPETSELYLPGFFMRGPIEPMLSAKAWRAEWDATEANMNTPRAMRVSTPGAPAGTPLVLKVFAGELPVREFDGVVNAEAVEVEYADFDLPDPLPPGVSLEPGQPFLPVTYRFVAEGGGRVAQSRNQVTYADRAFLRLVAEPGNGDPDVVLAKEPYVLVSPWGTRTGTTNDQGILDERGLPPGSAAIVIRERHMINLGTLPHNWDGVV